MIFSWKWLVSLSDINSFPLFSEGSSDAPETGHPGLTYQV